MSKTKEELEALRKDYTELSEICRELTPEELEQVTGGARVNAIDLAVGVVVGAAFVAEVQ